MRPTGFHVVPAQNRCCLLSGDRNAHIDRIVFRYPGTLNGNILMTPAIRNGLLINPGTRPIRNGSASYADDNLRFIGAATRHDIPDVGFNRSVHDFTNIHTGLSISSFVVNRRPRTPN